jgi:hypothetical protein
MGKILVDLLSEGDGLFGVTNEGEKVRLTINQDNPLEIGDITYSSEENLQRQFQTFKLMNKGYLYVNRDKALKNPDERSWTLPYIYFPSNSKIKY